MSMIPSFYDNIIRNFYYYCRGTKLFLLFHQRFLKMFNEHVLFYDIIHYEFPRTNCFLLSSSLIGGKYYSLFFLDRKVSIVDKPWLCWYTRLYNTVFCFLTPTLLKLRQVNYAKACTGKKIIKMASVINIIYVIDRRK